MPTVIRVGLAWQPLWAGLWAALALALEASHPGSIDSGEGIAMVRILGLIGLVSGAGFAVLLATAEPGQPLARVPMIRVAAWGIVATAVMPVVLGKYDQVFPMCPAGAAVALALAAIARGRLWKSVFAG